MRLVVFTALGPDSKPFRVAVNPEHVSSLTEADDGSVKLQMLGDEDYFAVNATLDKALRALVGRFGWRTAK